MASEGLESGLIASLAIPGISSGINDLAIREVIAGSIRKLAAIRLSRGRTRSIKTASSALRYVSENTATYYFGKAHQYKASGIIAPSKHPQIADGQTQLEVIDLSSPEKNTRELLVSAVLAEEWDRAKLAWDAAMQGEAEKDSRVPIFLVIDEAHNFIPSNPRSQAEAIIREQFRTIAAEGRKYGLFLVLVSQRPDKLDDFVLSECGNKDVMRLDSQAIAKVVTEKLGMEVELARNVVHFRTGRILLAGPWAKSPKVIYCAARRAKEGGRNLQPGFWTLPYDNIKG